ncbi:hypothetical protein J2Y69_000832 [Microbacterium resistens]|uniref:Winged helix DNA-binding domain-containing protein n=1 Tax=Microbacterium resistens TaxID=156977 RepID=A0ABU1S9G5_9MICO|nr:winged helix DNA-binding domain-containing protein [Microbacterium resistens]MDR6866240.1 hypothetical protein [Microbacterium resistens]
MTPTALLSERLRAHRLTAPARTPVDAARHMLAVQSQDFVAGRWALGARSSAATLRGVDRAFARGDLVRTWTMRGTLHIVPASDLRWVLSITAERQLRQAAARHRELGIDSEMLGRVERRLREVLADGGRTRTQLFADIEGLGIDPTGQRGVHLLCALSLRGVLVQGPVVRRPDAVSREQLFVLADEHVPESPSPDDPLAEFFIRYLDGHGPAGVTDFAWWTGLPVSVAREAAERAAGRVREVGPGVFMALSAPRRARGADDAEIRALPMFDEYYISYADRSPVASADAAARIGPGKNGMVRASLVAGGRIVGAWTHSAAVGRHREEPTAELFGEEIDPAVLGVDSAAVSAALRRYADFLA